MGTAALLAHPWVLLRCRKRAHAALAIIFGLSSRWHRVDEPGRVHRCSRGRRPLRAHRVRHHLMAAAAGASMSECRIRERAAAPTSSLVGSTEATQTGACTRRRSTAWPTRMSASPGSTPATSASTRSGHGLHANGYGMAESGHAGHSAALVTTEGCTQLECGPPLRCVVRGAVLRRCPGAVGGGWCRP